MFDFFFIPHELFSLWLWEKHSVPDLVEIKISHQRSQIEFGESRIEISISSTLSTLTVGLDNSFQFLVYAIINFQNMNRMKSHGSDKGGSLVLRETDEGKSIDI